jgi:tRNA-dihydrouridine synthase A
MRIIVNGGIINLNDAKNFLNDFDGVMIGRAAWDNPWMFSNAENTFFDKNINISRYEIINSYLEYASKYLSLGHTQRRLIRPLFNMFYGVQGSKLWKQQLNDIANNKIDINSISNLAYQIEDMILDAA